jgi:hypothetical protein
MPARVGSRLCQCRQAVRRRDGRRHQCGDHLRGVTATMQTVSQYTPSFLKVSVPSTPRMLAAGGIKIGRMRLRAWQEFGNWMKAHKLIQGTPSLGHHDGQVLAVPGVLAARASCRRGRRSSGVSCPAAGRLRGTEGSGRGWPGRTTGGPGHGSALPSLVSAASSVTSGGWKGPSALSFRASVVARLTVAGRVRRRPGCAHGDGGQEVRWTARG